MKLSRIFLMAVLVSALGVIGCGDSGQSASEVCEACDNQNLRAACETTYDNCINIDRGSSEECVVLALAACGI